LWGIAEGVDLLVAGPTLLSPLGGAGISPSCRQDRRLSYATESTILEYRSAGADNQFPVISRLGRLFPGFAAISFPVNEPGISHQVSEPKEFPADFTVGSVFLPGFFPRKPGNPENTGPPDIGALRPALPR
jgi:hypothetical protein